MTNLNDTARQVLIDARGDLLRQLKSEDEQLAELNSRVARTEERIAKITTALEDLNAALDLPSADA